MLTLTSEYALRAMIYLAQHVDKQPITGRQIAEQAGIKGYSTRYRNSSLIAELDNCLHVGASWVNISWKGDFEQFTRLINKLERHRPVVLVDGFLISKPDNSAQGCQIELSLIILVDNDNGALPGGAEKPAEV